MEEKFYTIKELANILPLTRDQISELVWKGHIKGIKRMCKTERGYRKMWFIPNSELKKYQRKLLDDYIDEKLKILEELHIEPTYSQLAHLRECKTEFEVDAYYHDLITGKSRIK